MVAAVDARIIAAIVGVAVFGCGLEPEPPDPPPADFAELCGEAEPLRVLRFEPWRKVKFVRYWATFGERRLATVHYDDTRVASTALWSVGPCGEDPRMLISGALARFRFPLYQDPFVCDYPTGRVWVVDPTGERTAKLVFQLPNYACFAISSEAGLVNVRPYSDNPELGSVILQPWPDDVWADAVEPVILLDRVQTSYPADWVVLHGGDDEVFALTEDNELVRVEIGDGAVEVIATGVRRFELSRETDGYPRRYLLWQRDELANGYSLDPAGEILLLDRATNELRSLGVAGLAWTYEGALSWSEHGLVALRVLVDGERVLRLYRLPSLDHVDVEETISPHLLLADDRHMTVSFNSTWAFVDIMTGDLSMKGSELRHWEARREVTLLLEPEGELMLLRGDTPPELIARRATIGHQFLPDGRLLSAVLLDRKDVGDLIVIDPETLEERLVDRGVLSSRITPVTREGDEVVAYTILAGERAGLWLARLQPRE